MWPQLVQNIFAKLFKLWSKWPNAEDLSKISINLLRSKHNALALLNDLCQVLVVRHVVDRPLLRLHSHRDPHGQGQRVHYPLPL